MTDGKRGADASNPKGYLEFEAVKRLGRTTEVDWLDEAVGKAIKVVAPLLPHLPFNQHYRIIFMERPVPEVCASQRSMLRRLTKDDSNRLDERQLAAVYEKQLEAVRAVLSAHRGQVEVLVVNYHRALIDPAAVAQEANLFLGGGLEETAMAEAVEPMLRRERS